MQINFFLDDTAGGALFEALHARGGTVLRDGG